jgi:hypothetical protein
MRKRKGDREFSDALSDAESEQRSRELLKLTLARGFPQTFLTELFIAQIEHAKTHGGKLPNLPDFFEAVAAGKFDHLLRDKSGNSLS